MTHQVGAMHPRRVHRRDDVAGKVVGGEGRPWVRRFPSAAWIQEKAAEAGRKAPDDPRPGPAVGKGARDQYEIGTGAD